MIHELPDQSGVIVPADQVDNTAAAMEAFRRYAAEVWEWPDPVTNAGIEGPWWWLQEDRCHHCGARPGAWRRVMGPTDELEAAGAVRGYRVRVGYVR